MNKIQVTAKSIAVRNRRPTHGAAIVKYVRKGQILEVLTTAEAEGFDWVKIEGGWFTTRRHIDNYSLTAEYTEQGADDPEPAITPNNEIKPAPPVIGGSAPTKKVTRKRAPKKAKEG